VERRKKEIFFFKIFLGSLFLYKKLKYYHGVRWLKKEKKNENINAYVIEGLGEKKTNYKGQQNNRQDLYDVHIS
jgi:hypothetical protein